MTEEQWEKAHDYLCSPLRRLDLFIKEMERRGDPGGFRLRDEASTAYNALHSVCVQLHYLSCGSGVAAVTDPEYDEDEDAYDEDDNWDWEGWGI